MNGITSARPLSIRASADSGPRQGESRIFSRGFFLNSLLRAIQRPTPPVLLIDEIDRADEEFEAFLLEVLGSDHIPELGTIEARSRRSSC